MKASYSFILTAAVVLTTATSAADGPTVPSTGSSPTRPLFVWGDLAKGESRVFNLTDGREVNVRLIETGATRDSGRRHPVRSATATVEVNGQQVILGCGNYNLPTTVGRVQLDCPITSDYYEDARHDFWGLEKGKDARLRIWPKGSPLMPPGRLAYPVRQRWFASNTQMSNEPTWVDGGEERGPGRVYYHYGLDIGTAELLTVAVAAVDGTVVALKGQWNPEHRDVEPPHGITPACVFILDDWGWYHRYEHVQEFNPELALGKRVKQGQVVGVGSKVGGTAWSHIHYDIRHRHPGGGHWVLQDGYAFLLESYVRQYGPSVVAVARPHQVALTGEPVTLDASRSWSRDPVVAHEWTLSNGKQVSRPRVTRTYSKPGMYSEIVKVSGAGGKYDYDFAAVLVFDRNDQAKAPHTIHAAYSPTIGIKTGDSVTFKVRTFGTSDAEDIWDFADGSPPVVVRSLDGLVKELGQHPNGYATTVHRFEKAGRYIVRVERTNAAGVRAMTHLDVIVEEE